MAQMRVFLSYAPPDNSVAETVVLALRGAGADVWFDKRNQGMSKSLDEITHQLYERLVFIVLLSEIAFSSEWVRNECKIAFDLQMRLPCRIILPVVIAPLKLNSFDNLPYLTDFTCIERHNHIPYADDEMITRILQFLALPLANQVPTPVMPPFSDSVNDLLTWGRVLAAQKRWAETLGFFQRATERDPNNASAWGELGRTLNGSQRYAEVLTAHDRSLALNGQQAWVWNNKGYALNVPGQGEEALTAFDHALALDPAYIDARDHKGFVLDNLGRREDAVEAYDRSLALDPANTLTWLNKGSALTNLGRYEEALAAFNRASPSTPTTSTFGLTRAPLSTTWGATRRHWSHATAPSHLIPPI